MIKKFKLFILVFIVALVIPILMPTTNKNVKAYTNNDIVFYGNDISKWQGDVDFTKMQAVSDFVIIRVGYGTKIDENFITYMQNALKTKINVGVYLYSIASTLQEVVNEANWLVSILQENGFDDGDLTFPVYFDYEEISFIESKTKKENTDMINAFANVILNAGFYPGVYMGASSFNSYVNADDLVCDVWIANYFGSNNVSEFSAKYNNSHSRVKMWQYADGPYTSGGTSITSHLKNTVEDHGVSSENIDENFCFVD
ncbi:MAG: hypothetical protein J6C97_04725, partial [Clostridia bacterium]|nr:hypothetical protein [Clostridia bacterium]